MEALEIKILDKKIVKISLFEDINTLFIVEIFFRDVRNMKSFSITLSDVLYFDYVDSNLGYVEKVKYFIREDKTHYLSLDPDDTIRDKPLESDNCLIIARDIKIKENFNV